MIAKASVTETDENLTHIDCELSMAVLDDDIAMAEPAGEMPLALWP